MRKKKIGPKMGKVLVFGVGYIGKFYPEIMLDKLGFKQEQVIVIDIDEDKLRKVKKLYPKISVFTDTASLQKYKAKQAFVLVNTPNHYEVLYQCKILGIENVFVEKPLVYTLEELKEVKKLNFNQLYVGYLINGAEIVGELNKFISKNKLIVSSAKSWWGKNRYPAKRPVGGDAEEEMTHPLGLITSVVNSANGINSSFLKLDCTYNRYIQPHLLVKAKEQGIAYPDKLNDSSLGVLEMQTKSGTVFAHLMSSFTLPEQIRWVNFVLINKDDPLRLPKYMVSLKFDELFNRAKKRRADRIQIIEAKTNKTVFDLISHDNKLENQIKLVLDAFSGKKPDKRLVDLNHASELVHVLDKALKNLK